jgi:AbrB family looped-hinge helix DNA binding protein
MTKKVNIPVRGPLGKNTSCCAVEALVTVDDRGQMVLPKELRAKAGIKAGDKLAVTTWEKDGKICCIALIKADNLEAMVKGILGPVMKDIL